ncbi:hypothetical protein DRN72_01525 [Methanosarcinales archaeon]|nr:MAG: hypothetical protein DRN72_01525 [Methanosarcinales archaeon]
MSDIVITGGAGFIGSHIANSLRDKHEVVAVDDLSLGRVDNLKDVEFVRMSILDNELEQTCKNADFIIHLGSASSAPMFQEDLHKAMDVNVNGTINIFECASEVGADVIYASTSSLYSKCPPPHREDM